MLTRERVNTHQTMNEIEKEVLEELESATLNEEIVEAVDGLSGELKTAESQVLVNAAANMLAKRLLTDKTDGN